MRNVFPDYQSSISFVANVLNISLYKYYIFDDVQNLFMKSHYNIYIIYEFKMRQNPSTGPRKWRQTKPYIVNHRKKAQQSVVRPKPIMTTL